ncbi:LysR substrate-binding domain-containing protein [Rhizobium sp. LEGMi135b]
MKTFVRAADAGSFLAVADALDMSPQLVGKHVRLLEQHLGVRLLNRTTRRQSLTEFGEAFLERARSILSEVEEVERIAEAARARPVGRLRVNAPVTFGTYSLSPQILRFMQLYPEVTIDLTLMNEVVDVVDGGYDVVFRVGNLSDSSMIGRKLGRYRLILCASLAYLNSAETITHPNDLIKHECLGFSHANLKTVWSFLAPSGKVISVPIMSKFTANQSDPIFAACMAGRGVMLQPIELVREALLAGSLREVLPEFPCDSPQLSVLYPKAKTMTPKLRSFLDFCYKEFNDETLS